MPVFNAHISKGKFTRERKIAIGNALNLSLNKALGIPEEDRFVIISEHGDDELFIHPTFMGMDRSDEAMIITVMIGAHRPLSDKKKLMATITELLHKEAGINPDDVFLSFIPVPNENFSFGRGVPQLAENLPKW
ncbi:tautomerase family protein [Pectobacterium polaris]|uniref:tautomerase family protein n=1 Tax=Pectobacterium polaris TaxID=2042057 RepID=UPI000E70C4BD|nr:tautomerase family protein [Pectobacterium polaris]MDE8742057.1 tautomerase family protein [Pectobacterium polaris]MDE8755000.1 tautomerase family protein [Pectobacterium polaris]RJL30232.1 tautomerase family protein [Pectobacterium polaris]